MSCFSLYTLKLYFPVYWKSKTLLIVGMKLICDTKGMSHLSTIPSFLRHFLITSKWNWMSGYRVIKNLKQYKTKEFEHCVCLYLKRNISDVPLISLDHVTYYFYGVFSCKIYVVSSWEWLTSLSTSKNKCCKTHPSGSIQGFVFERLGKYALT